MMKMAGCLQRGAPASSSEASGPDSAAMSRLAGASTSTVQLSRAEAIWLVSASAAAASRPPPGPGPPAVSRRAAGTASTGTSTLVSAPPMTTS